jgi:long-subunit fatty acid transport protein
LQWDLWQSGFRLGAAFRSPVSLGGTARASGVVYAGTPTGTTVASSNVSFETAFPWSLALGAQWDWKRSMRWNLEYSFTNYSANEAIDLTGTFGASSVTDIPLQWSNQHVGRLGWEWQASSDAVLRAGYALTSRVTNPKYARVTYSSPGWGHSITGGGGMMFGKNLRADVALEFAFASGTVSSSDTTGTSNPVTLAGDYSTRAWVLHSSVGYQF